MKIRLSHDQLYREIPEEVKLLLGYTDEILQKANMSNIRLIDAVIGDISEDGENYIISPNFANANKLPRKVAHRDITTEQYEFIVMMIGEENIIKE